MSDKPEKLVVTVDRSKWRCGGRPLATKHGSGPTLLLNDNGYRCCLGFACQQMGVDDNALRYVSTPGSFVSLGKRDDSWKPVIDKIAPYLLTETANDHSAIVSECVLLNDDFEITDRAEREQRLIEATKDAPFTFQFVGEYESHNINKGETNGT